MNRSRFRDRVARRLLGLPGDDEPPELFVGAGVTEVPRDRPFSVLCWNLQYAGGREAHFFYDGGRDVSVSAGTVERVLDGIAAVLRAADADVVLLQEVDRDSRRTARIDQLSELLRRAPYPAHASTPYFKNRFVPVPSHEPVGRIDTHLCTLSRFGLGAATRTPLAPLREPWLRQQFNLRRAVLGVDAPIAGGGALRVLNTHLSAFSRGDGTLSRQVDELIELVGAVGEHPWLLAGDFNALPPGDDPRRLPDPDEYAEATTPILPLIERFETPTTLAHRSYLPPGATEPDRVLDWVFHGPSLAVESLRVLPEGGAWSDHLPILVTLRLGGVLP